ncbi:MAG: NAD(+)/NADH kinase [Sedimentisphaerales bacterium]|nr:NAD(+)/NADH kinase [Sedimentisphaerales bacterium]
MKPEDGYIAYIVNPKAGANRVLTAQRFERYLASRKFQVRVILTESLSDTCKHANDVAVDYDCAMVVAVGGDGTVREVADGLEGSDKPLLILPCGTENLLANELGLDGRLTTMIKAFESGRVKSLDLGKANDKCFTSVVGFGFDGEVVGRVSRERQGHIDYFDYFWPFWRTFLGYRFQKMEVEVDGQEVFDGTGIVFVGNTSKYALGLAILHSADCSDGLLDICIYKCSSKTHLLKHAAMTVLKQHLDRSDVIYLKGKEVVVSSSCLNIETEIDGDPGPALPVSVKVVPAAINCVVSAAARPAGIRRRVLRALS